MTTLSDASVDAPGEDDPTPGRGWRADRAGLAAGAALAVVAGTLGWLRYAHHWATALDLGLFDQGIWLLSRGQAPELTVIHDNLLGDHLSPVLVLFAPLYRLQATPLWMVAAQALAIGAAVPTLRSLARELGADPRLATLATVASAPLLAAATFDFHPVVMTVPFTALALVAAHRDDARSATWAALAVVLIRADAGVMLLGVALLARSRTRWRLVAVGLAGMAAGAVVPTLLHSNQTFTRYWGHLGDSPVDALLHPWRIPAALASEPALKTMAIWLLPVGFLPLARPRWALATLIAGLPLLLSSAPNTSLPWFHHAAALVPFTVGGALAALATRKRAWEHPATLVAGLVAALLVASPLSPRAPEPLRLTAIASPRPVAGVEAALDRIGEDEAVAADPWLLTRLARRERAYLYPCPLLSLGEARCAVPRDDPPPDVLVTSASRADELRRAGWDPEPVPGGDLVVARRAEEPG